MTRPPARCHGCQVNRVAWVRPRVDYCYDCLPGGPFTPPSCRKCGAADHFSEGLCGGCHPGGPSHLGSCRGCLAWGVYRTYAWSCWSCRWWQTHYPTGDCLYCGRNTRIGEQGACRLCLERARLLQEQGRALDLRSANLHGQQLFFANMQFHRRKARRLGSGPRRARITSGGFRPVTWRQTSMAIDLGPDAELVKRRALTAETGLIRYCKEVVAEHAARHGWSKRQTNDVIRSLRLLQVLQDTPGAKINATDVLQLPRYDGNIVSTVDVLSAAGMLIEDRTSHVERYFAGKTAALPAPMRAQLENWLEVMLNGSTTAPRQRSRDPQTARIQIMGIAPIVTAWAEAGHQSLAEITAEQVRAALPESGSRRNWAEYGLRSLFKVLKSRKLIFTNPTRGMRITPVNATVPLPLVAFHALTGQQAQRLVVTDIVDGRLALCGREIPLAGPVRVRLTAWLDYRARTWPGSINPHLFVSRRSAPRLTPVGKQFPWTRTDLRPQTLREDRILQEIHATGGDVRRICDLFGLSVETALRYALTLTAGDQPTSR